MKERTNESEAIEIDVFRLLRILMKKLWVIVLVATITASAGFAFSKFMLTPHYEASVLMYVNNGSTKNSASTSMSASDISAAQSLVDTYIVILQSRNTLDEVINQTGVNYTYEELLHMVSASSVNGTEIFRIKVNSTNPKESALLANTIADVLPDAIANAVEGSSVRVVDRAVPPTQKSSPSNVRYALIGLAIGVVLSCVVILLQGLLDDAIRDEEYLTQTYELPILALVPDLAARDADIDSSYKYKYSGAYIK